MVDYYSGLSYKTILATTTVCCCKIGIDVSCVGLVFSCFISCDIYWVDAAFFFVNWMLRYVEADCSIKYGVCSLPGLAVNTSTPASVTIIVCSNWADSFPSYNILEINAIKENTMIAFLKLIDFQSKINKTCW